MHFITLVSSSSGPQRGIDPNVDDPTQCHVGIFRPFVRLSLIALQSHSEVPQKDEDWPSLETILSFQSRVRQRVQKLYDAFESGDVPLTRKIARVLFMTHEHEGFHAEVFLMLPSRYDSN